MKPFDVVGVGVLFFACGVFGGVIIGRRFEQKAVAKVLSEFARVDQEAKSLVNRCYAYLSDGIKAELHRLGL